MPDLTVLAIDLGGSHATCAVIREGTILASISPRADGKAGLTGLLPILHASLAEVLRIAGVSRSECAALVFGFCGIVNSRDKKVLATNEKFDDAPQLDLSGWCTREFGLPFLLENDARLALLGEYRFGAACGVEDAVMITLGSGVGGAAMIGGHLLHSRHGLAGTIGGHMPVVLNGRLCSCGNRGCAEAEASTAFLPEIYRMQPGAAQGALAAHKEIGFAELFAAIEKVDKPAKSALDHCLCVWSALTVALIHAYDPEVVVFGGSVLKRAADILPPIQMYIDAHAWTPGRSVQLRAAALGSDAAILGAFALAESQL